MTQATPHESAAASAGAIARLNDRLRANITRPGLDRVVLSHGLAAIIGDMGLFRNWRRYAELLRLVRDFDDFNADNDPHGEHDGAAFAFEGQRCFWKIDYYNTDLSAGSENPADPAMTVRVLTIMHAADM